MPLTESLTRLVQAHTESGSPLAECLRPGLIHAEVSVELGNAGIQPHQSLIDLFGWANGIDSDSWGRILSGTVPYVIFPVGFVSLRESVENLDLFRSELADSTLWNDDWFPVFWGQTWGYVLDTADGTIWYVDLEGGERSRDAETLENLIERFTQDFAAGDQYFDPIFGIQSV